MCNRTLGYRITTSNFSSRFFFSKVNPPAISICSLSRADPPTNLPCTYHYRAAQYPSYSFNTCCCFFFHLLKALLASIRLALSVCPITDLLVSSSPLLPYSALKDIYGLRLLIFRVRCLGFSVIIA